LKPVDTAPPERLRLFVAVVVPTSHLDRISGAVEDLRPDFPGARWTAADNQHVTLKFLGATGADRLDAITRACSLVARSHHPATVALGAAGSFPSPTRSRVLWIGLNDPGGLLDSLARDLDQAFEPLGFATEKRSFTPHLTLCRFKEPIRLPNGGPRIDLSGLEPFDVSDFVLFRSHLSPKGARYEILERFRLGTREA
jgi:2'-5' RNA ligase